MIDEKEIALIEKVAIKVGMTSLLNHGAASCVYSEGCNGVTQDHLVAFAREVALHCVAALSAAAQPPAAPQEELREDASYESMNLAVMVLSDCGHSSNYKPLLERVAGRIDRHVERLLTAQRADLTRRAQAEPAQPEQVPLTEAARDVLTERQRQISVEGWTPEHDDKERLPDELALAAASYVCADEHNAPPAIWPWDWSWWKPSDRRRNLVKSGALILAEIERLDRAAARAAKEGQNND